jgi:hypothetical protein
VVFILVKGGGVSYELERCNRKREEWGGEKCTMDWERDSYVVESQKTILYNHTTAKV